MSTTWSTDWTTWTNAAQKHNDDLTNWVTHDKTNYNNTIVPAFEQFCKNHSPEEAMIYFLTIVLAHAPQPAGSNPNILAMYQDQITCYGDSMAVAADTTQLTNDLQNMFNDTTGTGPTPSQAYGYVTDMINMFQSNPNNVTNSFDPNQIQSILTQLKGIQSNLVQYFSFTYTPPGGGAAVTGAGSLTSFSDMNTKMGEKGDPDKAIEAAQGFTNANQALTANLQNVNASLNQQVSLTTGMINAWQSFESAVMKNFISEISASIQNEIAGG